MADTTWVYLVHEIHDAWSWTLIGIIEDDLDAAKEFAQKRFNADRIFSGKPLPAPLHWDCRQEVISLYRATYREPNDHSAQVLYRITREAVLHKSYIEKMT